MFAPLKHWRRKVTPLLKTLAIQENGVSQDITNFGEKIMTAATSNAEPIGNEKLKGIQLLKVAFRSRKTAVMLFFGFSAGLPYTLLLGTLNAWLGEAKVSLATIGILSWIGLAYAFKFLWSPLVDRIYPAGFVKTWAEAQLALAVSGRACAHLLSFCRGLIPCVSIGTFAIIRSNCSVFLRYTRRRDRCLAYRRFCRSKYASGCPFDDLSVWISYRGTHRRSIGFDFCGTGKLANCLFSFGVSDGADRDCHAASTGHKGIGGNRTTNKCARKNRCNFTKI